MICLGRLIPKQTPELASQKCRVYCRRSQETTRRQRKRKTKKALGSESVKTQLMKSNKVCVRIRLTNALDAMIKAKRSAKAVKKSNQITESTWTL